MRLVQSLWTSVDVETKVSFAAHLLRADFVNAVRGDELLFALVKHIVLAAVLRAPQKGGQVAIRLLFGLIVGRRFVERFVVVWVVFSLVLVFEIAADSEPRQLVGAQLPQSRGLHSIQLACLWHL